MARMPEVSNVLDAQLRRVARGDAEAFAGLYDATSARIYGLVIRILRDPGYSEETTQDVYAQVWRCAAEYDPEQGSALAWLMTLAHRRAVDRVRAEVASSRREARYVAVSVEPDTDVVADSAIRSDEQRQVADLPGIADRPATASHRTGVLRRPDLPAGVRTAVDQSGHRQDPDARRTAQAT